MESFPYCQLSIFGILLTLLSTQFVPIIGLQNSLETDGVGSKERPLSKFRFLVIGDTGGISKYPYTSLTGRTVAATMSKWAIDNPPKFVINVGDNFYEKGVTDVDDSRFAESFENLYPNDSLGVPWYTIAGNHDHLGNVHAQIAYTALSKRWKFPNLYYDFTYDVNVSSWPRSMKVHIVAVDTMVLCGKKYFISLENSRKILGDPDITNVSWSIQDTERHWDWVQEKLNKSKGDYLLVVGHYPVYSVGFHGPDRCLLKKLRPLLFENKVTAYICGHDHNQQYLSEPQTFYDVSNSLLKMVENAPDQQILHSGPGEKQLHYLIYGSGSKIDPDQPHKDSVPDNVSKYFQGDQDRYGGFGSFYIDDQDGSMRATYVDGLGDVSYEVKMNPRII